MVTIKIALYQLSVLMLIQYVLGTSMASPGAAGVALLIRQYFMDTSTRFWKGYCDQSEWFCKSFTPSGFLIKAVILHAGQGMNRFDGAACRGCGVNDITLKAPPDSTQGTKEFDATKYHFFEKYLCKLPNLQLL